MQMTQCSIHSQNEGELVSRLRLQFRRRVPCAVVNVGLLVLFVVQTPALTLAQESGSKSSAPIRPDVPPAPAEEAAVDGLLADDDLLAGDDLDELLDLAEGDVGQLTRVNVVAPSLEMEVTSVSRQKSTIGRSPAAVFVITNDMIRRSGARSIPEALRLAPGVQVARLDGNKWAVSIRGFNGRFANKMLVQIDGRSVYTPLFAGVFWDVQDTLLEDIDRIEVIRGPGATVWGANAVNGVINIITKSTEDTQGSYFNAGAGNEDRGFAGARYGGRLSDDATFRLYGKWFERDTGAAPNGDAHDDWRSLRGGFRIDWTPTCVDRVTLQGDYYDGSSGQRSFVAEPTMPPAFVRTVDDDFDVSGGNVLARWTHELDLESDWSLQMYYDRTERAFAQSPFSEDRDTIDIDFQYRVPLGDDHKVIMGAGYRMTADSIVSSPTIAISPADRSVNLFSYFIQDEITLVDEFLFLTGGSKFQHNDYTGFEMQPTLRLLWTPTERHSIWGAVSHAVRTPSRAEDDVSVNLLPQVIPGLPPPTFQTVNGSRSFESEELTAFEFGYREQPTQEFSWDLAVFLHEYRDLTGATPGTPSFPHFPMGPTFLPTTVGNTGNGLTYGFEVASTYEVSEWWRVSGAYSFLKMDLDSDDSVGTSPQNQAYIMNSWDLTDDVQLDVIGRYVDSLPGFSIPSYMTADIRLGWHLTPNLELTLAGRHLFDAEQPEFGFDGYTGTVATQVEREFYGMVTWRH